MTDDIAISVRNISKKFRLFKSPTERLVEALHPFRKKYHSEFWALKNVDFDVCRGEIVGIMGRNGSGKSTLLQIICSIMEPTGGEVSTKGRISALLELGAGFNPEFTGRENVLLNGAIMGFTRKQMQDRLPDIEAFANIGGFFDQPVKTYSSGMFVRVAFAAAIHIDPDILVVDEALSVGDVKFQHRCFQRIRAFLEQGKTILLVSHSTDTMLRLCNRGVVIERGSVQFVGPIGEAVNAYQNLLFGKPADVSPVIEDREVTTGAAIDTARNAIPSLSVERADRIGQKPNYNEHESRLGAGGASIIDFDLVVNGKLNPAEIPANAEVELTIKITFETAMDRVSVGFGIVTIDGVYVFGSNLAMMEKDLLAAKTGDLTAVTFEFTSHLTGGEYFLNLGCTRFLDGEDVYVDVRRSVAKIKFSQTPHAAGFVNLDLQHTTLNLHTVTEAVS